MPRSEQHIVRQILSAVEDDEGVSQRSLAAQLGISVGSVNWYLKRCIAKGLIKLRQAPVKRYLYYLTPKGFEEKARLTAAYMRYSLAFFREGREACEAFYRAAARAGVEHLALAGDGELAEIAALSAHDHGSPLVAVIDAGATRQSCAGIPIVGSLAEAADLAGGAVPRAILLTDLSDPKKAHETIARELAGHGLGEDAIHIPKMLRFRPQNEGDGAS